MPRAGAVLVMLAIALPGAGARAAAEPAQPAAAQAAAAQPAAAQPAAAAASSAATPASAVPSARIEARSSDFLAVGTVRAERMTIHVSRLTDNAPVRDATVSVVLRGTTHPAIADSDGGYGLSTPDLAVPGPAAVLIDITEGTLHEQLSGTLEIGASAGQREEHNTSRQVAWWVLNFAVCIGFLMLWNRRRAKSSDS
jgi:hypothetical protein